MGIVEGLDGARIARAVVSGAALALVFALVARGFTRKPWKAVLAGWLASAALFALACGLDPRRSATGAIAFSPGAAAVLLGWAALRALAAARRRRRGAASEPPPPGSLAGRHWRGEVPLGLALLDLAVFAVASLTFAAILSNAPTHRAPRPIGAAVVLAWAAFLAGAAWALVGVWRASRARGAAPALLRWPARGLVVGGLALVATIVAKEAAGSLSENARVAFGPSERGSCALTLLRGGRELHLRGALGYGVAEGVREVLDAHPGVKVLQLHSGGGRVVEGFGLAELAGDRGLVTYVGRSCASACVIAFAGGRERWMGRGATFGLHRPTSPTGAPVWSTTREVTSYLVGRGVSPDFVKRGMAQTYGMWEPSREEVMAAGLVTRLARPDDVALPPLGEDELARIPLVLRGERFFEMLYEFERPLFDRLASGLREGHQRGLSEQEAIEFLGAEIEGVLERHLPVTSDRAATTFFREIARVGRSLEVSDPGRCAAMLAGSASGDVAVGVPAQELLDATAGVILDAQNHPGSAPGPEAGRSTAVALLASLKLPPEVRKDLDADGLERSDPRRFCSARLSLLEAILSRGEGSAGPTLRYLAARSAADGSGRRADRPPGGARARAARRVGR